MIMSKAVAAAMKEVNKQMSEVIGKTSVDLTIYDPEARTDEGQQVRIVRRAETNLGDLVADAFRDQTGAEVAMVGGGDLREECDHRGQAGRSCRKIHAGIR